MYYRLIHKARWGVLALGSITIACGGGSNDGSGSDAGTDAATIACGNGEIEGLEECDDGADNSDTVADACRTDCSRPRCGDGVIDTGEACDDGPANSDVVPDVCRFTVRSRKVTVPSTETRITDELRVPYISEEINNGARIRSHASPMPVSGSSWSDGLVRSLNSVKTASMSRVSADSNRVNPSTPAVTLGHGVFRNALLSP